MEILKFIFESIWHFLGTLVLLSVAFGCISQCRLIEHNHYHNKKD